MSGDGERVRGGIPLEINGGPRTVSARNIATLLEELGYPPAGHGLAVAVNGEVVRRVDWEGRELAPGDRVEIVGAVQGG